MQRYLKLLFGMFHKGKEIKNLDKAAFLIKMKTSVMTIESYTLDKGPEQKYL